MRKAMWMGMIAAVLVVASGQALGAQVTIAEDGMAVVDGQRLFVLGLYEMPGDAAHLADVAEAGFNLVQATASVEQLDRLQQAGIHAWVNTGARIALDEDRAGREAALRELASTIGVHPALLAWEVPDEALWNCWYGAMQWRQGAEPAKLREAIQKLENKQLIRQLTDELNTSIALGNQGNYELSEAIADRIWRELGQESPNPGLGIANAPERAARLCAGMREGYSLLKSLDTAHPIWMNHAPRNQIAQLTAFGHAADVAGCDIYPVPEYRGGHSDLPDRSMVSVGEFTDRMQAAIPGKPVWMVLQGFGWADLQDNPSEEERKTQRRPTFAESRFMAYDAIVHGARGVLYWGTAYIEKDSPFWADLLRTIRELADEQPLLSAPDAAIKPEVALAESWGSLAFGLRVLGKQVGNEVSWIVVNEAAEPLHYTLGGLTPLEGVLYTDDNAGVMGKVEQGALTLTIPGRSVQILKPNVR